MPEETARRVPPAEAIAVARNPTAARGAPAIAYFNCLNEGKCVLFLRPTPYFSPIPEPNVHPNQPVADDARAAR